MLAFVRRLGVLIAIGCLLSGCAGIPESPHGPPGTATEAIYFMNGQSYLFLREWGSLVKDERLWYPLLVAYTQLTQWRPIAQRATILKTTFTVRRLDGGLGGQTTWNLAPPVVTINEMIMREPIDVQAAVIAHETYHAQSSRRPSVRNPLPIGGERAQACLVEEIEATAWEAYAYATVVREGGNTGWTRGEDDRQRLWEQGRTAEAVLLNSGYQKECLGGSLP